MPQGIMVVTEQSDAAFRKVTFEILSEGKRIADQLDCQVTAVVLGSDVAADATVLQKLLQQMQPCCRSMDQTGFW